MNLTNMFKLTAGCKEFQPDSAFALGSNTFDYSSSYELICNKTDNTAAALSVFDLGYVRTGARVVFEIEALRSSGTGGIIAIESRTTQSSLSIGRKIVGLDNIAGSEWRTLRTEWIVSDGLNFISANFGGSTLSVGVYKFRNPILRIYENDCRLGNSYCCNLVRVSNVWSIDSALFHNTGGFKLVSGTGDNIQLSFKEVEGMQPVAIISVDTGFSLTTAGFVNAGPNTVTKNSLKIKLIKSDGTFASDVTDGGTCRLNVTLHFQ